MKHSTPVVSPHTVTSEEPANGSIVTSACAKAAGVVAPIPATIANSTKKEQIALVFIDKLLVWIHKNFTRISRIRILVFSKLV
jgi:hypothetical protein